MKGERELQQALKSLAKELRSRTLPPSVNIQSAHVLEETETGGWGATVAKWDEHPDIELWLDSILGGSDRHFWFGFMSEKRKGRDALVETLPSELAPTQHYSSKVDLTKVKNQWKYKRTLSDEQCTTPLTEDMGHYFFGMYDRGVTIRGPIKLNIWAAATFIHRVVAAAEDAAYVEYSQYRGSEGRRKVVTHYTIERDPRVSQLRKQRDKYRCQVCTFDFIACYGVLGTKFAEAHHLVPLNQLKSVSHPTIDDLITVCANCHRMLHRMKGIRTDVPKLRGLIAEEAAAQRLKGA